ncbi:MAG: tRNA (adenosine(37)-N6)-dimethylallyltransferase MiaA [Dehalococcoidia bacterium]|nr:tRNA (adenosine(37)-N6)-dimethylallyltransferase MiaA [Dehalococcoidia bacterium]
MKFLISIVGPTAVGKSSLALELCQVLDGEIINADSRQVYRYMDIGTAKPTLEEQALVPHHLIDEVKPDEDYSLALYQQQAFTVIDDIRNRGKTPFLVGGTGLYIRAVLERWRIPPVPPDPAFRQELEKRARIGGAREIFEDLKRVDPLGAEKIDPRNIRRVIRALEVSRRGIPYSQLQVKEPLMDSILIGLTTCREELYRIIDERVDRMMEAGLLEEVRRLMTMGYGLELPSMSGLGYRQLGIFLKGEIELPEAVKQIKFETHRFARQQYNWFRPGDKNINWFERGSRLFEDVTRFVRQCQMDSEGIRLTTGAG